MPEKFRFSAGVGAECGVDEPKSCVMTAIAVTVAVASRGGYRGDLLEAWLGLILFR